MNKGIKYTVGPYQLSLDITNKCNLRCLHCYNASGENVVMEDELTDIEIKNFLISILPMKLLNLCFCGGETLLRKDIIYEGVRMLSNNGIRASLVTNGILASEIVIRNLYYAGLKSIQFSIDGYHAESHDRLRNQKGVYDKVMHALDIARKYEIELSVAFTPTSFNLEELELLHSYMETLSYKSKVELRVQPLMPLGRGNKNMDEICPNEDQYRQLVSTINRINHSGSKLQIVWGDPIDHLIRFPYLEDLPMYYTSIRANGDIVVSPYLPLVIGNIRKHRFEEYWTGGLHSIWKKSIPQYMASFLKSIGEMAKINERFPDTFMNDIYIDMLEDDLDDMSILSKRSTHNVGLS